MEVDSVGIIAILSMSYITTRIVKKIDKCGKNLQSARKKTNFHTKCGKKCYKILSVWRIQFCSEFYVNTHDYTNTVF